MESAKEMGRKMLKSRFQLHFIIQKLLSFR